MLTQKIILLNRDDISIHFFDIEFSGDSIQTTEIESFIVNKEFQLDKINWMMVNSETVITYEENGIKKRMFTQEQGLEILMKMFTQDQILEIMNDWDKTLSL